MKHLTIAVFVAAALGSGAAIAQEQKAAQTAAKAAAKSTQVAQAGGAVVSGGASTGAATTGAVASFGSAVVSSVPFIGITAGMTAVGSAASNSGGAAATQH
jgi:CTP synthase (UTP-ammonia lyase)